MIGFLAKFFIHFIVCLLIVAPAIMIIYGINLLMKSDSTSLLYIGSGIGAYCILAAMDR